MEEDEGKVANVEPEHSALTTPAQSRYRKALERVAVAALGSLGWVGGVLSVAAAIADDLAQQRKDELQTQWLEEHTRKLDQLKATLSEMSERFTHLGSDIVTRLESEEYLDIVRRAFRTWDRADSNEKRRYVANLVTHAGGTQLCSDDVVKLFVDWLDQYHEAHFAVIREIYQRSNSTRMEIWRAIRGAIPREDSADADLYRLLIRDLSTGGVVRQARATNSRGEFYRKEPSRKTGASSSVMESAFEDTKGYVLTALGKQFVHYTMNDVVPRLGDEEDEEPYA